MTGRDPPPPHPSQLEVFATRATRELERQGISRRALAHQMQAALATAPSRSAIERPDPYEFPSATDFVAVSQILAGTRTPSFSQMSLIAETLGVGLVELLIPDRDADRPDHVAYVRLASGRVVGGEHARAILCDHVPGGSPKKRRARQKREAERLRDARRQDALDALVRGVKLAPDEEDLRPPSGIPGAVAAFAREMSVPPEEEKDLLRLLLHPDTLAVINAGPDHLWVVERDPPPEVHDEACRWVRDQSQIVRAVVRSDCGRCGAAWQRATCVVISANEQRVLVEHPTPVSADAPLGPLATFAYSELKSLVSYDGRSGFDIASAAPWDRHTAGQQ